MWIACPQMPSQWKGCSRAALFPSDGARGAVKIITGPPNPLVEKTKIGTHGTFPPIAHGKGLSEMIRMYHRQQNKCYPQRF